jgi:hypothetical protein
MKRILCALTITALTGLGAAGSAHAQAIEIGHLPTCTEAVPAVVTTTTSVPVTLNVRVLLDGLTAAQAGPIMTEAQKSYFNMGLRVSWTYASVAFSGTDGQGLIDQAKAFYGGQRPAGTDLVYVLTAKDIEQGVNGNALAGLADCIGGVAFPDRSFAVGEGISAYEPVQFGPLFVGANTAARVAAHELGHLMGAHHHYANCPTPTVRTGDNLCTLMINDVGLAGRPFSVLNQRIVHGHAQLYARP